MILLHTRGENKTHQVYADGMCHELHAGDLYLSYSELFVHHVSHEV